MEFDSNMIQVAKNHGSPIIMMHMKGIPKNMQNNPSYDHLISEVKDYLFSRANFALNAGIDKNNICLLYTSPSPRDVSTSRMPSSA